jgi:hypothetical protein
MELLEAYTSLKFPIFAAGLIARTAHPSKSETRNMQRPTLAFSALSSTEEDANDVTSSLLLDNDLDSAEMSGVYRYLERIGVIASVRRDQKTAEESTRLR